MTERLHSIPWHRVGDAWRRNEYWMRPVKCASPPVWEWILWVLRPDGTTENIAFHRLNSLRANPKPPRRWAERAIRAWERAR